MAKSLSFFIHPIPLVSVVIMALNDHFLKYQFHNALTGKLSDVMGIFFFPLYLCAIYILMRSLLGQSKIKLESCHLLVSIGITSIIYTVINTSLEVAQFYELVMGKIGFPSKVTLDASDLLVLPVCLFTYLFGRDFVEKHSTVSP